jgi:hypothetical protein
MGVPVPEMVKKWCIKQRCKYRLFQLREKLNNESIPLFEVLEYSLTVFDEFTFPPPDRWLLSGTEIESKIRDVYTLKILLEAATDSHRNTGSVNYNKRLIADTVGFATIFDWYWSPISNGHISCEQLLRSFKREFDYFISYSKKEENRQDIQYLERSLKPLINNYHSLINVLEYVYLRNE